MNPRLAAPSDEPQIVLIWLTRLRWLAVTGQVLAVLTAVMWLGLDPPLQWVVLLIGLTALTNVVVTWLAQRGRPPRWLVPGLLMLDVLTLTGLLACTGGSGNPFKVLYLVHVAMAVVTLPVRWVWAIVLTSVVGYGLLLAGYVPLTAPEDPPVSPHVLAIGEWLAVTLVAMLIAYFIGRLVRALRERERELALTREIAARNEQLAGLTTLAAGAAHELGTPLGTIALVAKEMERYAEGIADDDVLTDARLIRQECDRCRHILDRMRVDIHEDGVAGTAGASSVDPATFIQRVHADLEPDEKPRLDIHADPDLQADIRPARALQQALGVLLSNAFEASGPGGRVALALQREANRLKISVTDEGHGMDEATLRRAGQPFFTTKEPGVGMGLGLFLVRLVAERSGGTLSLASQPHAGTTATLDLPAEVLPTEQIKPARLAERGIMTQTPQISDQPTILVVDDDKIFRERLVRALHNRGLTVYVAEDADTALEAAKDFEPERAVLDLRMPGRGGLELVEELHKLDPTIQIVVLTGYGSIATAVEAVKRGAIDYLTKPADTDQILAAFDRNGAATGDNSEHTPSLARVEWEHIQRTLADTGGNISETARRLGIHRRSLQRKLGKLPPFE